MASVIDDPENDVPLDNVDAERDRLFRIIEETASLDAFEKQLLLEKSSSCRCVSYGRPNTNRCRSFLWRWVNNC